MYINISDEFKEPNWQRFNITPQEFHRDKRDHTLLIIDSPAINAAFHEFTHGFMVGKLHLFVPNYLYSCDFDTCSVHYRAYAEGPGDFAIGGPSIKFFDCFYSNEELEMLVKLRYPMDAKNEALFADIVSTARYGEFSSRFASDLPNMA